MIDIPPLPKLWMPSKPAIIRATELPRSDDFLKGVFAPGFMGKPKATPSLTLALRNKTTSTSNTVSKPSGCVAGDLLVVASFGYRTTSAVPPTVVVPSGFTSLANTGLGDVDIGAGRLVLSWRLATGSEDATFSGVNSTSNYMCCYCFSGGISSVTPSTALDGTGNGSGPSNQTIASGSAQAPVIAIAAVAGAGASSTSGSLSPTADDNIGSGRMFLLYKLYNSSPVNVTAAYTGTTTLRYMQSAYLACA